MARSSPLIIPGYKPLFPSLAWVEEAPETPSSPRGLELYRYMPSDPSNLLRCLQTAIGEARRDGNNISAQIGHASIAWGLEDAIMGRDSEKLRTLLDQRPRNGPEGSSHIEITESYIPPRSNPRSIPEADSLFSDAHLIVEIYCRDETIPVRAELEPLFRGRVKNSEMLYVEEKPSKNPRAQKVTELVLAALESRGSKLGGIYVPSSADQMLEDAMETMDNYARDVIGEEHAVRLFTEYDERQDTRERIVSLIEEPIQEYGNAVSQAPQRERRKSLFEVRALRRRGDGKGS